MGVISLFGETLTKSRCIILGLVWGLEGTAGRTEKRSRNEKVLFTNIEFRKVFSAHNLQGGLLLRETLDKETS